MMTDEDEYDVGEGTEEEPEAPAPIDLDSPSYVVTSDQMDVINGATTRKTVSKPDISHLPEALGPDGRPLFKAGDRIVIERHSAVLAGTPYLNTRTYRVLSLDESTGDLALYDDSLAQHAGDNWRTGPRRGNVYKMAAGTSIGQRRRGRPRKNPVVEPPKPVVLGPDGTPVKKRRGRPPGAKNRPKDVIAAERAERKARKKGRA